MRPWSIGRAARQYARVCWSDDAGLLCSSPDQAELGWINEKGESVARPTEKQLKFCRDLARRNLGEGRGDPPVGEDGKPVYEKSIEDADAFIKANMRPKRQWTNREMTEQEMDDFDDRNHPSDWGVPNC